MRLNIIVCAIVAILAVASEAKPQSIPAPTGPPAFADPVRFTVADIVQGLDYDLRFVEADQTRPGKELLVYLPTVNLVTVGRWHPTKHGVGGVLPGAGICVEAWKSLTVYLNVWNFNTLGDADGDGIDDWVLYLQDGTVDHYRGRGLNVCR